jgi:hypothetical protein
MEMIFQIPSIRLLSRPRLLLQDSAASLSSYAFVFIFRRFFVCPSSPVLGRRSTLWICVSSMHVLLAASRPANENRRDVVFYTRLKDQACLASSLGLACTRLELVWLLVEIWRGILLFRKIEILVPHVSPYIMSPSLLTFFQKLQAHGLLAYYDDGMSSLSRRTHLFRQRFIPPKALIHAWNFEGLRALRRNGPVFPLSSLPRLMSLLSTRPWLAGFRLDAVPANSLASHSAVLGQCVQALTTPGDHVGRVDHGSLTFVLASKSLNPMAAPLRQRLKHPDATTYYLPHYQSEKNCSAISKELIRIFPAQPELFLFCVSRHVSVDLFFGVTSSVVLLMELILAGPYCHRLKLFPCIDLRLSRGRHWDECEDYIALLDHYRRAFRLEAKGIELMPVCCS